MERLSRRTCVAFTLYAATAVASAQTFTTLVNFNVTNGSNPENMSLIQGTDGYFYGTTTGGGTDSSNCPLGCGTIFKMTPDGTLTTLYYFNGPDGATPTAGLVQSTNRNFYGTTAKGGANGYGTVFKMTPDGMLTTLFSFDITDGAIPIAGLVQATNGHFYGTTHEGGASNAGTVFRITPMSTLTTLHSFDITDGLYPSAGLVQATDGNFYGTTEDGGANGYGTVFKITSRGTLTTVYSFCSQLNCVDGTYPLTWLVQASDGHFYGTTQEGGANNAGTVFKITPRGRLTTLYSFCSQLNCTDGAYPIAGLVLATDGNLYGTTEEGGSGYGNGTVFEITLGGVLTTLHSFDGADGDGPGAMTQGTDGNFYGTTIFGGLGDGVSGTVFSLSVGLGPFVKTLPTSGKVGAAVKILGTNLTGATSVSFNGIAASFTVVSASQISTTVPAGATTGYVQVMTPVGGTLFSNVAFRVIL